MRFKLGDKNFQIDFRRHEIPGRKGQYNATTVNVYEVGENRQLTLVKTATSRCHPNDRFELEAGRQAALNVMFPRTLTVIPETPEERAFRGAVWSAYANRPKGKRAKTESHG